MKATISQGIIGSCYRWIYWKCALKTAEGAANVTSGNKNEFSKSLFSKHHILQVVFIIRS